MRTLRLFSMAAVALAMAACSNDDSALELQTPAQQDGRIPFTATIAAPAGDAATRTVFEEGTDGDSKPIINVKWKVGDEVALIHNSKKDVMEVKVVNETDGTATISGTIDATGTDGEAVTVVYPAASVIAGTGATPAANASYLIKGFQQDGTLSYIANNIDARRGTGTIKISGTPAEATLDGNVTLTSGIAIWKLTLKDGSSSLSANEVTLKVGGKSIAKAVSTTAKSDYYMCVVPATMGTGDFTIEATVSGVTYLYTKTGGVTLTAGKYYESEVTMAPVTDLSMVDCAGAARTGGMSTANCYMVHKAGMYKLPLVYGNAIKNGAVNSAAYTGITSEKTTETFPNHAGNAINAPWITRATIGEGVNQGMGISVKSAELLWQDAEELITAVGISDDGDYLTLTVGKDAATQQGNALVAAKDASNNIVWSWHIWVTTETFATLTTVSTGSHTYSVTPVNLGWVPTGGGYNTYYQWGRKEPFKGTGAPADLTVYDIDGNEIAGMTYIQSNDASNDATIADNIKNPTTFYNNSNTGPCNTTYYNMWDAQQKGAGNITTATGKTVYDPCPAGFCVPTGNLYYFMGNGISRQMSTWDGTNKGATWNNDVVANSISGNDLFFPASGYRNYSDGSLYVVGSYGYCWSASAYSSNTNNAHLSLSSDGWYWRYYKRATGYPVRAVAEEE